MSDTFSEEQINLYKQEELDYISGLDLLEQEQWEIEAIEGGPDQDSQLTPDILPLLPTLYEY